MCLISIADAYRSTTPRNQYRDRWLWYDLSITSTRDYRMCQRIKPMNVHIILIYTSNVRLPWIAVVRNILCIAQSSFFSLFILVGYSKCLPAQSNKKKMASRVIRFYWCCCCFYANDLCVCMHCYIQLFYSIQFCFASFSSFARWHPTKAIDRLYHRTVMYDSAWHHTNEQTYNKWPSHLLLLPSVIAYIRTNLWNLWNYYYYYHCLFGLLFGIVVVLGADGVHLWL